MFITKAKRPSGKYQISISKSVRDLESKKIKRVQLKCYGTYELNSKEYENTLKLAEKELKEMQELEEQSKGFQSFEDFIVHTRDKISTKDRKIGYLPYLKIYNELKLPSFFKKIAKNSKMNYSFSDIMFFQLLGRLFNPCSKHELVSRKNDYLYNFDFVNEDNIYSSMDVFSNFNKYKAKHFNENKTHINDMNKLLSTVDEESKKILEKNIDELEKENKKIRDEYNTIFEDRENKLFKHLNKNISKIIPEREMSIAFYDCTSYYFESFTEDELREKGMSKDNKRNETQVVMGLLIDTNGIPISYKLFRGNLHELKTMEEVIDDVLSNYTIKDIIIVADRGLNSKENMKILRSKKLNYIVGSKSNAVPNEIKNKEFDDSWHKTSVETDEYRTGYITGRREISDVDEETEEKITCTELIIKKYSDLYKQQQIHKQEEAIKKARKRMKDFTIENTCKSKSRYYKTNDDPKSRIRVEIDEEKIIKERENFGYFYIITNKTEMNPSEVIGAYNSLYKIEESFRILKTNLRARPVYHFIERRIKAHFLICYLALVLERLLEYQLKVNKINLSTNELLNGLADFKLFEMDYGINKIYMITDKLFYSKINKNIFKLDRKVYMNLNELKIT